MVKKQNPRAFTRYVVKEGNTIKHGGITERPVEERADEHLRKWPNAHVNKVGPKVTEKTAREWEKEKGYS